MRMPCRTFPMKPARRALFSGLLAALCWLPSCSAGSGGDGGSDAATPPYPAAEAAAVLAEIETAPAEEALLVRARTAAARLRTDATEEELPGLQLEMELCVQALTLVDGTEAFPWADWIEADRGETPALAAELLRAANHVLDADGAMILARSNDSRETGLRLRIQSHQVMWERDPAFADARARHALFRENPRDRDRFRPALLEEVLTPRHGPQVDRLLLDVAVKDTMESRARRLALTTLASRELAGTAAVCESIFDTESTDLLVRQEALRTIAALDPERLIQIVERKTPPRNVQPILHDFMHDLRSHLEAETTSR